MTDRIIGDKIHSITEARASSFSAPSTKVEDVEISLSAQAFLDACVVTYEEQRQRAIKEWNSNGKPSQCKPPPQLTRDQIKAACLEDGVRNFLHMLTGHPHAPGLGGAAAVHVSHASHWHNEEPFIR